MTNGKQRRLSDNIDRLKKELARLTEKLNKLSNQSTYYFILVQAINEISGKMLLQGIEVSRKTVVVYKRVTDKK